MTKTVLFKRFVAFFLMIGFSHIGYGQSQKHSKKEQKAQKWNTEQFETIKKKFAFSYGCDIDDLELVVLESRYDQMGSQAYGGMGLFKSQIPVDKILARSVGVNGCERKAMYVFTPSGWVLNSNTEER